MVCFLKGGVCYSNPIHIFFVKFSKPGSRSLTVFFLIERGATEFRKLERAVFKSLVQFPTGLVSAVKGARTTGSHSKSAVKVDGPMASGKYISINITRTG